MGSIFRSFIDGIHPPVGKFLQDQKYLMKANQKLLLLYVLLIAPIIYAHSLTNFKILGSWYYLIIGVLLFVPHFGFTMLVALTYLGVFLWDYGVDNFSYMDIAFILGGCFFGIQSAALMHNTAHNNIRTRWLNSLVGEICALQQLVGMTEWAVAHILYHHKYPDDPDRDPHPPEGKTFFRFIVRMKFETSMFIEKSYYEKWGKTKESQENWQKGGLLILSTNILRASFWFFLLGPTYYLLFFIPAHLMNNLTYAHFNYYTHRPDSNGFFSAINCEDKGIMKIINFLTYGSYYHKNHHINPRLFNPKSMSAPEK